MTTTMRCVHSNAESQQNTSNLRLLTSESAIGLTQARSCDIGVQLCVKVDPLESAAAHSLHLKTLLLRALIFEGGGNYSLEVFQHVRLPETTCLFEESHHEPDCNVLRTLKFWKVVQVKNLGAL
jgi:hypothetical protein